MHVSSTLRQESLPRFRYRLATGIYRHAGERKREGETERERETDREREREPQERQGMPNALPWYTMLRPLYSSKPTNARAQTDNETDRPSNTHSEKQTQ